MGIAASFRNGFDKINRILSAFPLDVALFVARIGPSAMFYASGRTKVDDSGFGVSDTAVYLFEEEYQLPLIDPTLAAYMATIAEHVLPILLLLGLFTRLSAFGLLIMTIVIQVFVYPLAYGIHLTWAACFLLLMVAGAGRLSLDYFLLGDKPRVKAERG